jgi:hypothetical protein
MRSFAWSPSIWPAALCLLLSTIPGHAAPPATLGAPGRTNATPSIAADGPFVAVVWGGAEPDGTTDVFLAVSRDAGRTFGAPRRVNDTIGDARLNGEQPPQVALVHGASADPAIVVVWTTKGKNGTTLRQSRSDDGGKTFGAAATVPGTDAVGNRGWEAIAVGPDGRVDVIWLDHRELASDTAMASSHHDHTQRAAGDKARLPDSKPDGVAMAQKSKLYFASLDGSAAPRAVTAGVCYCCKTALVSAGGGSVYAAWRHVYPGNLRDMAFTMSRDGGRTFASPVRVSEDQWVLEGCPDDGPSMAVDRTGRIHLVWPTLVKEAPAQGGEPVETIALFYSMSADGRTFGKRQRIPTEGLPHHPRIITSADGTMTVVWDELAKGSRRVAFARARAASNGVPSFRRQILTSDGPSVYPVVAAAGADAIVAWTSGTSTAASIRIERISGSGEGR